MRFSLRALFILVAFVAAFCWLGRQFYLFDQRLQREESGDNLRQIGIGLTAYQSTYGSHSPLSVADSNGKPLFSWRYSILPFLDSTWLAMPDASKPWNHPKNASLAGLPIMCLHASLDDAGKTMTSYVAVVGPGTAWTDVASFDQLKHPDTTIIVIEVFNSGIHWAEPRDISVDDAIATLHDHGGHVLFADGHVENLPAGLGADRLKEMLTVH
jgi:prepilin-type processing-associated H-X9-DG protein